MLRGKRQEDPVFPQLFTATIQEFLFVCLFFFLNAKPEEKGINIDRVKKSVRPKLCR